MNEWNLNVMLIIAAIAVLIKMVDGYRKGMVKEVISLVSLVVLSVVAALLAYGVNSYHDGKVFNVVAIAVLLILLLVAHHLLSLVFFSAKLTRSWPRSCRWCISWTSCWASCSGRSKWSWCCGRSMRS